MDRFTRMDELLELLIAKTGGDVATASQLYEGDEDTLKYFSEVWLLFNSNGDLVKIRKYGGQHAVFERDVKDATVSDRVVDDTKTIKYEKWHQVSGK